MYLNVLSSANFDDCSADGSLDAVGHCSNNDVHEACNGCCLHDDVDFCRGGGCQCRCVDGEDGKPGERGPEDKGDRRLVWLEVRVESLPLMARMSSASAPLGTPV